ncbi:hypothetical protein PoB_002156700 [Plakobranchus ocellatus]|uniref:Uncharacterized protein n=1 Tax=Plakobranchus ocellatus TaxID=259542 RepID=A0AAV3ZKK0_9GAST|nr:hypothetical protein PoB_002156700 [Plakobranchus ocellatus]
MLREQTSSMKCSQTWAKTSTGEAKEPVENGRRQCVGFGWATRGSPRATFEKMRNNLFVMPATAFTLSGIFYLIPRLSRHQEEILQCN